LIRRYVNSSNEFSSTYIFIYIFIDNTIKLSARSTNILGRRFFLCSPYVVGRRKISFCEFKGRRKNVALHKLNRLESKDCFNFYLSVCNQRYSTKLYFINTSKLPALTISLVRYVQKWRYATLSHIQGDQIGRIFAQWAIVSFGQFFWKITELSHILCYFFLSINCVLNLTKMRWATFWAIFKQTHLVALLTSGPKWRHFVAGLRLLTREFRACGSAPCDPRTGFGPGVDYTS
jgi:hypothetical protein